MTQQTVETGSSSNQWDIDAAHTGAHFSVRHLMVSNVRGEIHVSSGSLTYDPAKPEAAKLEVTLDAKSIDTREAKRDEHLRSADFFDVEKFPTITFKSKSVKKNGKALAVTGESHRSTASAKRSFSRSTKFTVRRKIRGAGINLHRRERQRPKSIARSSVSDLEHAARRRRVRRGRRDQNHARERSSFRRSSRRFLSHRPQHPHQRARKGQAADHDGRAGEVMRVLHRCTDQRISDHVSE